MITKSYYCSNQEAIDKAKAMALDNVDAEFDQIDFGFKFSDVMYFESIPNEDTIVLTFRNGREKEIVYSNAMLTKLKSIFNEK